MKRTTAALAFLLALAACGGSTTGTGATSATTIAPLDTGDTATTTTQPDTDTTTTTVPDVDSTGGTLLLRLNNEGGFVPVEYLLTDLTDYLLYSDGRLVFADPNADSFQKAIKNYLEVQLDDEEVGEFLELIDQLGFAELGLDDGNFEKNATIADAQTAVAEYFDDAGTHRYSVYALGIDDFEDADGRVALMNDLFALFQSKANPSTATPVQPDRIEIWTGKITVDASFHTVEPWEFDIEPAEANPRGFNFTCSELSGADATQIAEQLASADTTTVWERDGETYSVVAKPLLPGETACPE